MDIADRPSRRRPDDRIQPVWGARSGLLRVAAVLLPVAALASGPTSRAAAAPASTSCSIVSPHCSSRAARSCDSRSSTPAPAETRGARACSAPAGDPRPGVAALRVARDPETGDWMLAPLETLAGREAASLLALNQSDAGLVEVPLEGGGYAVDLQGRFQSFSVASRALDGTVATGCVDDPWGVAWWLSGDLPRIAPATPRAPEK